MKNADQEKSNQGPCGNCQVSHKNLVEVRTNDVQLFKKAPWRLS
jgi:hypothetical protein